jgi:hypothetical protein
LLAIHITEHDGFARSSPCNGDAGGERAFAAPSFSIDNGNYRHMGNDYWMK